MTVAGGVRSLSERVACTAPVRHSRSKLLVSDPECHPSGFGVKQCTFLVLERGFEMVDSFSEIRVSSPREAREGGGVAPLHLFGAFECSGAAREMLADPAEGFGAVAGGRGAW